MEKNSLSFDASLVSVYKLFKDNAYNIPVYQRDYSWEREQWEQLWNDLSGYKESDGEEHFLGPIIITPSEDGSDISEVIDGQQRMTTLQIIIAIIRDQWVLMGDKSVTQSGASVPNKQLTSELIYSLTPTVRYNFTPNKHLRKIFLDFIQRPVEDKNRKKFENKEAFNGYAYSDRASEVVRAYKYFSEKIMALGESDLRKFEHYFLQRVRVLVVRAGGSSNAFLLFETLNYRGLELTQTDLVKSYLFSRIITEDSDDKYVNEWDQVVENVGNKSPDLFLRHYLLLYSKKVLKRDIYAEIKIKYKTKEAAIQFVDELQKFSSLYSYIVRENDFQGTNKAILNSLFNDLALLSVDTQNIYLLAILYRYYSEQEKMDLAKIENAARLSETLSFRWTTCGRNAQDLETIYQEAASMIMDEITPDDNFENAQELILNALPSDQEFTISLQTAIIKSNRRAQYILRKIDEWQNGDGSYVLMDPTKLHLEHVAPQRPSGKYDWKLKMKGDSNYREIIYRIGNLVLLPERMNKEASNLPFEKKKPIYIKNSSKLPTLTKEIATIADWNQNVVNDRSKDISMIAAEVWSAASTRLLGKAKEAPKRRKRASSSKAKARKPRK
jgi:uncharacterized protein with ParB-like and HNH nuclease domain